MLKASNFIVEGKGFLKIQTKAEYLSRINDKIDTLMYNKNYSPENRTSKLLGETFFSNTYYYEYLYETPYLFKIKKNLGLMSQAEITRRQIKFAMENTRNDLPLRVVFSISFAQIGNDHGILLTARTEAAISYKMQILPIKPQISYSEYQDIIDRNKDFITEIITAIGFKITEKPRVIEDSSESKKVITLTPTLFKIPDEPIRNDCVSVMMPFKKEFDNVLEAIKNACSNANMSCHRADDFWKDSLIIQDVFELIYRSSIVIVDFSGKNPNVFYESGIAHTIGKDVIPITQHLDDVPFDLQQHRILPYLNNSEGLKKLTEGLEERLKILKNK